MNKLQHIEKEVSPGTCPKCGGEDIDWHGSELFDQSIAYNAQCLSCRTLFTEEYSLQYETSVYEE